MNYYLMFSVPLSGSLFLYGSSCILYMCAYLYTCMYMCTYDGQSQVSIYLGHGTHILGQALH